MAWGLHARLAYDGGKRLEADRQPAALMIDATHVKAHRSAAGGKGGRPAGHRGDVLVAPMLIGTLRPAVCIADTAYDSDAFRNLLKALGTRPVIPNNPSRKRTHPFDARTYRRRNVIERTFSRLKDFRRIATRYDKLASSFLAAVAIASIVSYWLWSRAEGADAAFPLGSPIPASLASATASARVDAPSLPRMLET